MSSTVHSQHSKQWWPRPPGRANSLHQRTPKLSVSTSASAIPTSSAPHSVNSKSSKPPSRRFNSFASVIGFRSKKSLPQRDTPPSPMSPPLPLQKPPSQTSPGSTLGPGAPSVINFSHQHDLRSRGEIPINRIRSSEEWLEPWTPCDQLSRHRSSYQSSLFSSAEKALISELRLRDSMHYMSQDARRISVMSDPSVIDPHMVSDRAFVSKSAWRDISNSTMKGLGEGTSQKNSSEHRASFSGSTQNSTDAGCDPQQGRNYPCTVAETTLMRKNSSPPFNALSASRKHRSSSVLSSISTVASSSRTTSPAPMRGLCEFGGLSKYAAAVGNARHQLRSRPKAASVSNGSLSGSSLGEGLGARISHVNVATFSTSTTSLSRKASATPGGSVSASSSITGSIHRQPSVSRLRAVPPSRNPPPITNIPPTPGSRSSSPAYLFSSQAASSSSLVNPIDISASEDASVRVSLDLSPSSATESPASSINLYFAQPGQVSEQEEITHSPRNLLREYSNKGSLHRDESFSHYIMPTHYDSPSTFDKMLMSSFGARKDAQAQPSAKRSDSQQSLDGSTRGERPDSQISTSVTISPLSESPSSVFGSVGRTLRKQRSMHNTRALAGSLAMPPLPQQLRHASSFNTMSGPGETSGGDHGSHHKSDSVCSSETSKRHSAACSASAVHSSATTSASPHTPKKRYFFSSHARDRRDSNAIAYGDRDKHDGDGEKKKLHSIGRGIFSSHFSPSSPSFSSSEQFFGLRRTSSPPSDKHNDGSRVPQSPVSIAPPSSVHVDLHILPPKELLSQMEAFEGVEESSTTPQLENLGDENGIIDEFSLDSSSLAMTDRQSMLSRVDSIDASSSIFEFDDESSQGVNQSANFPVSTETRYFATASSSIQRRLNDERPSSASRLPSRSQSVISASSARPSTAEPQSPTCVPSAIVKPSIDSNPVMNALPPPPRRRGTTVSIFPDCNRMPAPMTPILSRAPSKLSSFDRGSANEHGAHALLHYNSSSEDACLTRFSSRETMSSYNPDRRSIFRKPSFLNIGDDVAESPSNAETVSSLPEDSFLILEHGKDSLDMGRSSAELYEQL